MMKLNSVPWMELRVGDRVVSAIGNAGEIYELHGEMKTSRRARFDEIDIIWDHGGVSSQIFHMNADKISYIGRSADVA